MEIIRNEYGELAYVKPSPSGASAAAKSFARNIAPRTPQQLATDFLARMRGTSGFDALGADSGGGEGIVFEAEKSLPDAKVVVYHQTALGLPVFDARLSVHVDEDAQEVVSMQSSAHAGISVENPGAKRDEGDAASITKTALTKMLGTKLAGVADLRINRQVVYRYTPENRQDVHDDEGGFEKHDHTLDLPRVPGDIRANAHYVADEVLFRAPIHEDEPAVNWRALVEPQSGAVLHLRALTGCVTGLVFDRDPQTQTGAAVTGASGDAVLNPFRSSQTLEGIVLSSPQTLTGNFVQVMDTGSPAIAPPTVPGAGGAFNFDVSTDDFAAVNAYYHCDKLFRTMQDFGFNVADYFDGTSFPVPVDHRALGNAVNAQAPGTATGDGLMELRFALLQAGTNVGIATSNRVVWHEFGHALLWDHVGSPNFGFAHSAGDALAAILNDPDTQEADRFDTFPWVQEATPIGRRHDRAVSDGWAWFGPQYNTQYRGEQILATTLFRFYRSIGGDSANRTTRRLAADTTAFLIFKAIGLMASTTSLPEVFVNNLISSDITTRSFKDVAGGALHKVIRWSFEKQGLYHPNAQPGTGNTVAAEGNPPDVDVYIDDGRGGEYGYQRNHWSCRDMWVRNAADGGLTHQNPRMGRENYMYVRVKNRGMQTARNVAVKGFHADPGSGLAFPNDWTQMTVQPVAGADVAPGAETIVGPIPYYPSNLGHSCLMAIVDADGDLGNDSTLQGNIRESRFVPFDNNVAQRNVTTIRALPDDILEILGEQRIIMRNPFDGPRRARITVRLPRFLQKLGWRVHVSSRGGTAFEIRPFEERLVTLKVEEGAPFEIEEAREWIKRGDSDIVLETYVGDELTGGMTYALDADERDERPRLPWPGDKPVVIREPIRTRPVVRWPIIRAGRTIADVLNVLDHGGNPQMADPRDEVANSARVRTVRIEFDLDYDDDLS